MQDILKEYGPAMITLIVVVALIALISVLIQEGGIVAQAFEALLSKFFELANASAGVE